MNERQNANPVNIKLNKRQRRLRVIAFVCVAVVLADVIAANLVDDFSELAEIWWVLAVPIGLLLVGTIGIVAAALLTLDRRNARRGSATTD